MRQKSLDGKMMVGDSVVQEEGTEDACDQHILYACMEFINKK